MTKPFKYAIALLTAAALVLFCLSFLRQDPALTKRSEARKAERHLIAREHVLDRYCKAILSGKQELGEMKDLPEDLVIYHYKSDTLHCWMNQFPIANDAVSTVYSHYRLHHLLGPDQVYTAPLAYLDSDQSYVNLGSGWYFIKYYRQEEDNIIGAVCVKREYPQESLAYANEVNPHLKLDKRFTTAPLSAASGVTVSSASGKPLFSIVETTRSHYSYGGFPLHWVAILLLAIAAFLLHLSQRSRLSLSIYLAVITLLALWARHLAHICDPSDPFFSPLTYAGNNLLDSLASLLTINTYIFMAAMGLFLMRVPLLKWYRTLHKRGRALCAAAGIAAVVLLAWYINFALRSLIFNSNISLNLARVHTISIYSIVCLVSFAMLFLALLHALQVAITTIAGRRVHNVASWSFLLPYLVVVSLYCTLTIYSANIKKEFNSNKVWTDKLSVDRDLSLEMQLRMVESGIKSDQLIAMLSFWPNGGTDVIRNRILERYLFRSFSTRYNLSVTTCNSATQLIIDRNTPAVNCLGFYSDELRKYGVPLTPSSSFFFMNNFNGQTSYLGVFTYVNYDTL